MLTYESCTKYIFRNYKTMYYYIVRSVTNLCDGLLNGLNCLFFSWITLFSAISLSLRLSSIISWSFCSNWRINFPSFSLILDVMVLLGFKEGSIWVDNSGLCWTFVKGEEAMIKRLTLVCVFTRYYYYSKRHLVVGQSLSHIAYEFDVWDFWGPCLLLFDSSTLWKSPKSKRHFGPP